MENKTNLQQIRELQRKLHELERLEEEKQKRVIDTSKTKSGVDSGKKEVK